MPEDLSAAAPLRHWGHGPRPVLALHCSLAHGGAWAGLAERLEGVSLTAPDLPGHGRAGDWDGATDLHASATEIAIRLAEQLGQGAAVDLFGHSFGGTVALRIALERPDLVRSLVLVEPVLFAAAKGSPAFAGFHAEHARITAIVATDRPAATAAFHALWGANGRLEALPARQRDYIVDRIHLIGAQTPVLVEDAAGLLAPGRLEQVAVPVLLAEGGDSPAVIDAVHAALAARLPQAMRMIVPGAGHMLPITHPDLLARAVQAHLDAA